MRATHKILSILNHSCSGGYNLGKMCRWHLGMSGMCVVFVVFDVVSHVSILEDQSHELETGCK